MSSPLMKYKENEAERKRLLLQEASFFLNKGISVSVTKAKSEDVLVENILSRDELEFTLASSSMANVGVMIGKTFNLIALVIEPGNNQLSDLEEQHGNLPSTMALQYPNGTKYKLFTYPDQGVQRTSLGDGVKVLHGGAYEPAILLLEHSELSTGMVRELSSSRNIAILPVSWQEFLGTDPLAELQEDTHYEEIETEVAVEKENDDCSQTRKPEEQAVLYPNTVQENSYDQDGDGSETDDIPEEYLLLVIVKLVRDGCSPIETVSKVKKLRDVYWSKVDDKTILHTAYREYCIAGWYDDANTENEKMMRFIADVELQAFKDHHQELCCKIIETGELVVLSSRAGGKVSDYLAYRLLQLERRSPKDVEVKNVLKVVLLTAKFEGKEVRVFNRVGIAEGKMYYDLGGKNAVELEANSWKVVEVPPIFRRYANHSAQITPVAGGNIDRFFEFVNHEPKDKLLISVYMVAALVSDIAHPVLYVYGSHGGAKSSLGAKIKAVIDPGKPDKLILSNKKEEIIRNLKQHYVSHYDNISYLSSEISDLFCTASTGAGMDNRKKYTDEESHIMSFKHCLILNGIKLAIKKPDLLDRSILVKLKRVDALDEIEINRRFEEALPEIMGGVFDTLSKAMSMVDTVQVSSFRMASFAKWGYAIAEALGGHGEQFLADYRANITEQNDLIAASNSLAHAVLTLMEKESRKAFTIGKAYSELRNSVRTGGSDKTFPKRDKDLRPCLEELGPVLDSFGIRFEFGKIRSNIGWTVTFYNDQVETEDLGQAAG